MADPQTIDVRHQQIVIKTKRGRLIIGPNGRIDGLRQIIRRELRTNAQVRKMCGRVQRSTLIRWRGDERYPFPEPWLRVTHRATIELWSRTEVEQWLEARQERLKPPPEPWETSATGTR